MSGYIAGEITVDGHSIAAYFSEDAGGQSAKVECPAELEVGDVVTVGGKPWQVVEVRVIDTLEGAYSFAGLRTPTT